MYGNFARSFALFCASPLNPMYAAISAPKKTKVVEPLTANNKATPIVLLKLWNAESSIITTKVTLLFKCVFLTNP